MYPFVILELQRCPLAFVDKMLNGLLKILEYTDVRTRNLTVIDINLNLQFLSPKTKNCKYDNSCEYCSYDCHPLRFASRRRMRVSTCFVL